VADNPESGASGIAFVHLRALRRYSESSYRVHRDGRTLNGPATRKDLFACFCARNPFSIEAFSTRREAQIRLTAN
jgi:hypothetical protein